VARIRTIKPEFFHSKSCARVHPLARLTFAGLWTVADDQGRFRGDERTLAGAIWTLDDDITHAEVAVHLKELEREDMVCRYEISEREYLHVVHWNAHQRINRPTPSRLPPCPLHEPPPDSVSPHGGLTEDSLSPHGGLTEDSLKAHVPEVGSRKLEVGSRRSSKHSLKSATSAPVAPVVTPAGATEPQSDTAFEEFWKSYPRRVGKEAAKAAWSKAATRTDAGLILTAARRYAEDPNLPDKKFIPHPATWLNQGRWDDEPCAPAVTERPPAHRDRAKDIFEWANELEAHERASQEQQPLELTAQPWLSGPEWGL
jgi:hypothetical protein